MFRSAFIASLLGVFSSPAIAEVDCLKLSVSVKHSVTADPAEVLQIVEKSVGANPSCACEIVKAAIEASEADAAEVAAIVEVAGTVAPDQLRLITQCAVAVAPDALVEVQIVAARLDPNKGEGYSAKSAKSAKKPLARNPIDVKPAWNPLNFPGQGPVGPNPGGPGGIPVVPFNPPPTVPPVINPPAGTDGGFLVF